MTTYRQITSSDTGFLAEIAGVLWDVGHPAWTRLADAYDGAFPKGELRDDHAGWTYSLEGELIGFSLADRAKGQILMTAVLPELQEKRIGRELLRQAEGWLWSHGWKEIRLVLHDAGSGLGLEFLKSVGWKSTGEAFNGNVSFVKAVPGPSFLLEEHIVNDPDTGYSRLLRLQRGPTDRPHVLCLLLDGELYWRDMEVMSILNPLMESGRIPPVTFAFVGCVSSLARQEDFICNERYERFIGGRVMGWLRSEIPTLREGGHLIGGLSLSGLMASYVALKNPRYFNACLSQSGSHWWEHAWFREMTLKLALVGGRFWLSVGDLEQQENLSHSPTLHQEISQIEGVERLAATLRECGATVRCHRHSGGHSYQPWKEELGEALSWLLERGDSSSGKSG
ncbi:MAG: GNAT family N-acetyltransferase [Verrucomicrobiaceae bacterium]|nr:MAG: GNAT family N-acetyltransferase [Verrucomicrobiaceae bacterium]